MVEEVGDEVVAIRDKILKAAAYLRNLMLEGNTRLVMIDLFRLGTLGQIVAIELHKLLTDEQKTVLVDEMATTLATDAPRFQQRRSLEDLVRMHDLSTSPSPSQ